MSAWGHEHTSQGADVAMNAAWKAFVWKVHVTAAIDARHSQQDVGQMYDMSYDLNHA